MACSNVVQPLGRARRSPAARRRPSGEKGRFLAAAGLRRVLLDVNRDGDLLHRLADLHQLRRAGLGMRLQLPPLGPVIGRS